MADCVPMRFQTQARYYQVDLYQDMFLDWVVVCDYGGRYTRAAHRKIIAVDDHQSGLNLVAKIAKMRVRHGYSQVSLKMLRKKYV